VGVVWRVRHKHFFYDPATIRKEGNIRRVWGVTNFSKREKNGAMSLRSRIEYDCKQERYRLLATSSHPGGMAGGSQLANVGGDDIWDDVPPSTPAAAMLEIVCAK
jgi:hypothetical protein